MPKKKVKMEAKEQSSPSTTTMEDKSKIENLIALAVAPSRLTQPALEDSPESWGKLIELTIKSPLVSGAVTTIASMLDTLPWRIEGGKAEDIEEFLRNSGFDLWKFEVIFELLVTGNSFLELVMNPRGSVIDRVVKIEDITTIDIKREGWEYLLDENGKPVAYIQQVPRGDRVEIPAKRMCHLKLWRYPGRIFGVGLVEPIYFYEKQRMEMISNLMLFASKLNRPFMVLTKKEGREGLRNVLSEEQIHDIEQALKKFGSDGALLLTVPFNVEFGQTSLSSAWVPLLKVLTGEVLVGLGIPQALLFAELRTTPGLVRSQEKLFHNKIESIISRFEAEMTSELIRKIDPEAKFVMERPTPLYMKDVVEMIGELARAGMLEPELVNKLLQRTWTDYSIASSEVESEYVSEGGGEE